MAKNILIAVAAVVVVALGWVWFSQKGNIPSSQTQQPTSTQQPATVAPQSTDTTASINTDINSVDTGNLDQQFQSLDQSVNSL